MNSAIDSLKNALNEAGDPDHWDVRAAMETARPGDEQWQAAADLFDALQPEFELFHEALDATWFVGSIEHDGQAASPILPDAISDVFSMLIDASTPVRTAMRWLSTRARHHALTGDGDAAFRDLTAAMDGLRHYHVLPTLLSVLMKTAIESLLFSTIIDALSHDPDLFDEAQLMSLRSQIDADPGIPLDRVAGFETVGSRWMLSELLSGHEHGRLPRSTRRDVFDVMEEMSPYTSLFVFEPDYLPEFPPEAPTQLAPLDEQVQMSERLCKAFVDAAQAPSTGTEPNAMLALFQDVSTFEEHERFYIVLSSAITLRTVVHTTHRLRLDRQATRCILEIHRHRLATGDWPATLANLPDQAVTLDPYTAKPFGYAVSNGRPKLWASGIDRDNDDGRPYQGSPNKWFSLDEWSMLSEPERLTYDGDIVLFPPEPDPAHDDN